MRKYKSKDGEIIIAEQFDPSKEVLPEGVHHYTSCPSEEIWPEGVEHYLECGGGWGIVGIRSGDYIAYTPGRPGVKHRMKREAFEDKYEAIVYAKR